MNKVAVVSGGSNGIGKSIVKLLRKKNITVYNLDIQTDECDHYLKCNLANKEEVNECIMQIIRDEHTIDYLVSSAGIHFSGNIEQTTYDDFNRVLQINVGGTFNLLKAVLPYMKKNNAGKIVLLGSDQSKIAKPNSSCYNLSKHAIASLAKTTAIDYAKHNILVNAVCPGTIETPLYHNAIEKYAKKNNIQHIEQLHKEEAQLQPLNRIGQPDEVADLIYFLLSDKNKYITGSLQMIDGGYTAI